MYRAHLTFQTDFQESPPSIVTVPLGTNQPPNKPSDDHKEYFYSHVCNWRNNNWNCSILTLVHRLDQLSCRLNISNTISTRIVGF